MKKFDLLADTIFSENLGIALPFFPTSLEPSTIERENAFKPLEVTRNNLWMWSELENFIEFSRNYKITMSFVANRVF